MKEYKIVNRGDGPKIEGTRITVFDVLEYSRKGRSRESIAVTLGLSSRQVEAALNYIDEHEADVNSEYEEIVARIRQGNPAWVQERLEQNRPKFEALLARARRNQRHPSARHAQDIDNAIAGNKIPNESLIAPNQEP